MSTPMQALIWGTGFILFGLALHVLSPVLLPFVVGFAVAYFLDPLVKWLVRHDVGRTTATTLVLLSFFSVLVLALVLLFPLVQGQITEFLEKAPELIRALEERVRQAAAGVISEIGEVDLARLKSAAGDFVGDAVKFTGTIVGKIWSGGLALINLLSLIFISPIVAFYMLRDWDRIVAKIDSWLPRDHAETIRGLVREADTMVAGFVRGVGIVCLVLAAFYGTALSLIGLDFGLVIGLFAGFISFIPFVGAAVGFVLSVGVALVQFGDWAMVGLTAGVFIVGQALEGNFLTPKLVGDRVQLHPVWVIFALLAAGLLFGFVGVLLAVPAAAVIGVLVRFFIGQYLNSRLYRGNGTGGVS